MEDFNYKKLDVSLLKPDASNAPAQSPFLNKKIVFTGDLNQWDRSTAAALAQAMGADVNTSISRKTEIVILGKGAGPAKLEKIIDLLADGVHIRLMNEKLFNAAVEPFKYLLHIS